MSVDAIVQGLRELPTATISDALDRLGIVGQCLGIAPLDPSFRLAGRAFTLRYRPTGVVDKGNVGDYIDDVPTGDIVVLDNAGRLDCTVWSDILTAVSSRRGIGGGRYPTWRRPPPPERVPPQPHSPRTPPHRARP